MFAQTLLPALALIGGAIAQSASICSQATATINSQADATQYASCSTISGDVLIGPDASGTISLDGPQQIKGSLLCSNAGEMTSFSSATIGTIGGSFNLFNLTLLSNLQFDDLQTVGNITWGALPALSELTFTAVVTKANAVIITNTFLSTLEGIDLETVGTLDINNNNRLKTFTTQVANITSLLNIDSNGRQLDVTFPNLIWAANMTFRNVSTVSLPSLATVNGSLGFYGNYFDSVAAPNLTTVGGTLSGSLAFVENAQLSNVSMPVLKSVGGAVQVANNSDFNSIAFPVLSVIGGAIDFSGNFSTPSLPALTNVKGGFNMQSESQIDCSGFQSDRNSGVIQGVFTCKTTTNASGLSGTSTASGSSPSKTKGAATQFGVSDAVVGLSFLGGLLQMLV